MKAELNRQIFDTWHLNIIKQGATPVICLAMDDFGRMHIHADVPEGTTPAEIIVAVEAMLYRMKQGEPIKN